MQNNLVLFIIVLCIFYWLNRFFPIIGKFIWLGTAYVLKRIHAPTTSQQWALKHCNTQKAPGCSSCSKCNSKCH